MIFWYKKFASLLQNKYTLYSVQDSNMDGHKVVFQSLEDMASYYLEEMRKIYSGEYYSIGGVSFSSTVAFEMAAQLTSIGKKIEFLGFNRNS